MNRVWLSGIPIGAVCGLYHKKYVEPHLKKDEPKALITVTRHEDLHGYMILGGLSGLLFGPFTLPLYGLYWYLS